MTYKKNSPSNKTSWITPKYIIDALGKFDLAPCCSLCMPWRTATLMVADAFAEKGFIDEDGFYPDGGDGLSIPWHGRVWLNPPYGKA